MRADEAAVADRLVFFISGFDPKGPAYYHRLFSDEARIAQERGHGRIGVSPRVNVGPMVSAWRVHWQAAAGGPATVTDYRFLRWDDIVRRHWSLTLWQIVWEYLALYADIFRLGVFTRLARIGRGPAFMTLMPLATAVGLLFGGALLLYLLASLVAPPALALAIALPGAVMVWRIAERRIETEWLLRLYGFTRDQAQGRLPDLEERLDQFATHIADAAARDGGPEVLVVGYSNGSIMAAAALARAIDRLRGEGDVPRWPDLLTLGHCTPVLASFPSAGRFRAELATLAGAEALAWVDYSAPADLAAFAPIAPWIGPAQGCKRQYSPRFHAALEPAGYERLRRDRRALHLQYLRAPGPLAAAGSYDFFALVAGPGRLAERHARRP